MVSAPLAINSSNAPLFADLARPFALYAELTFLEHNYGFFSPNPGWSPRVQFTATTESGEKITGHFPDHAEQVPELLYHRYMLLAEWMVFWPKDSSVTRAFARSIAERLTALHKA